MGSYKEQLEKKLRDQRLVFKQIPFSDEIKKFEEKGINFSHIDHTNEKTTLVGSIKEKISLYLDDERPLPSNFDVLVSSVDEGIEWLSKKENLGRLQRISFDWVLGSSGVPYGDKLVKYVLDETLEGRFPKVRLGCHTASDYGRELMNSMIREIYQYWDTKKE